MQKIMSEHEAKADVVVVGGGLAGLVTAIESARGRLKTILLERSGHAGGRAMTQQFEDGYYFNLGPHALYRKGAAQRVLRALGIKWTGGLPPTKGGRVIYRGRKFISPLGTTSLMMTGLLSFREKIEAARVLSSLAGIDADALDHLTLKEWLESTVRSERVRQLIKTIVRVTTYTNEPESMSAGACIKQVRLGLAGNVDYLDNGWQTLVEGALEAAHASGVEVLTNAGVTNIKREGERYVLHLRSGESYSASTVVLAVAPSAAASMLEGGEDTVLGKWANEAVPVKAACLDVALKRLPQSRSLFALGVDRPLYCIVHSQSAHLAPEGGAVIHVMKNHSAGDPADARADRRELEDLLDMMQPGWRDEVAHVRFLPAITVSNALVTARQGGTKGRPGPSVPGLDNLYVVGDWVGDEGMLLDASVASAHRAAELILKQRTEAALEPVTRERLIA